MTKHSQFRRVLAMYLAAKRGLKADFAASGAGMRINLEDRETGVSLELVLDGDLDPEAVTGKLDASLVALGQVVLALTGDCPAYTGTGFEGVSDWYTVLTATTNHD